VGARELRHDGYRLYTINGADWSKPYPLIVEAARKIEGSAISMLKWSGSARMASPISTRFVVG
jgi:hypothetical protein